jgi:ethanolamine utilization protein EutN
MQIGLAVGTATATVKHSTLQGWKLLVVQPLLANGRADGDPQLVVDRHGAGGPVNTAGTKDDIKTFRLP